MQLYDCTQSFTQDGNLQLMAWLQGGYDRDEDGRVKIDEMYESYILDFCKPLRREPQRKCEFGKVVRQAFPSVRNRRLGPIGRQTAFYCGISIHSSAQLPVPRKRQHRRAHKNRKTRGEGGGLVENATATTTSSSSTVWTAKDLRARRRAASLGQGKKNVEDVNTTEIGCESMVGEEEEEIEGLGEHRRRRRDEVEYSDLASRPKSKRLSGAKRREREVVTDNKNRHSVHKRQRVICERNSNNRSTNGNEEEHIETINQQGRRNSQKTTEQGLDSDGEEKEAVENESDFDSWDLPQEEEDMVLVETEPNTVSWLPEQEHDMGGFFLSSLPAFDALLTMQGPPTLGFFMSSVLGYAGLPLLL